jgi:UPF0716 family protein affecting phage T7 exclusion
MEWWAWTLLIVLAWILAGLALAGLTGRYRRDRRTTWPD